MARVVWVRVFPAQNARAAMSIAPRRIGAGLAGHGQRMTVRLLGERGGAAGVEAEAGVAVAGAAHGEHSLGKKMKKILADLLSAIADGNVLDVRIGLHWTAVVAEVDGAPRCGLASTLNPGHRHGEGPQLAEAGRLESLSGRELAGMVQEAATVKASVGMAAINALLPPPDAQDCEDINAEDVIASHGAGKRVALIGSFPFVPRLAPRVGRLDVLELHPAQGEMPASAAPALLPGADVVAITAMSLINHTLAGLLRLCSEEALVMLLGPSTPLTSVMFDHRVDLLCGSIVTDIAPVLSSVSQGANFRQVHRQGVRLVSMRRPGLAV
jgi:uncharacterized protein (DUF4213/DUF364 family)